MTRCRQKRRISVNRVACVEKSTRADQPLDRCSVASSRCDQERGVAGGVSGVKELREQRGDLCLCDDFLERLIQPNLAGMKQFQPADCSHFDKKLTTQKKKREIEMEIYCK